MEKGLTVSYETMNSSSYMAVTCPPEVELVNYELEMMLSNDIKNFLASSRQMLNGNTVIYFNITSRIPLKQVLDKRKLSRKEFFRLIEGILMAVRDAAAYRLPQEGIVFDPEYIYVNPATCAPAFLFLPLREPDGSGVKGLLSDLVLRDRLELSNDNFIQKLLVELNREPFSLDALDRNLKQYQIPEPDVRPETVRTVDPQRREAEIEIPQIVPPYQPVRPVQPVQPMQPEYTRPEAPTPQYAGADEGKDEKKKADKKRFLLPQAFVMVALAAGISFGLFTDKSGAVVFSNVLAFVIVVVLGEVILYREIFVNSKEKGKKEKKQKGREKPKDKKTARPAPPRESSRPAPPPPPYIPQNQVQPTPVKPEPVQPQPRYLAPEPSQNRYGQSVRQQPVYGATEDTDAEVPTELSDEAAGGGGTAYLEYYENGRLSRIPLNAFNEVVIGRLERQVDFVLKNPKVGNVHAKFFCQDGQFYVVDINSKNGTYINGSRARIESNNPYPLRDQDRIMLADSEFTIRCSEW